MTKIDIISGFLGAGKTTFIKKCSKKHFRESRLYSSRTNSERSGLTEDFLRKRELKSGR